jgi:hypothetical protein
MSSLARDQAQLLRVLTRFKVDFIVVGGVAAQVHGWNGATTDLDITVPDDDNNVARLDAALKAVGAGAPQVGGLGSVFETKFGRLEIVRRADGVGQYADWASNAAKQEVDANLTVVVADASDVVRSKEASGRQKDLDVLPQIRRDLIERGALDRDATSGPVASAETAPEEPPAFVVDLLGPRPPRRPGRWEIAAQYVVEYRERWEISGRGLGPKPRDRQQIEHRTRVEAMIAAVRSEKG